MIEGSVTQRRIQHDAFRIGRVCLQIRRLDQYQGCETIQKLSFKPRGNTFSSLSDHELQHAIETASDIISYHRAA